MLRSECETAQLIHCAETGDAANLRRLLGHYGLTRDYSHIPYSRTVLHRACIAGQRECVVELLKAGADPNEVDDNASTPLHLTINVPEADVDSVENGDTLRIIEALLQAGAKVNAADHWGETPLQAPCNGIRAAARRRLFRFTVPPCECFVLTRLGRA